MGRRVMMLLALALALCVFLPAVVTAGRPMSNPFFIRGCVYCDSCRAGYEIPGFTTPIAGACVRIECKSRETFELTYQKEGHTDSEGNYEITVDDDHGDEICDVVLVSSPQSDCASAHPGSTSSRVPITRSNGIIPPFRFANNLGFLRDQSVPGCAQILKQYQESD